MLVRAIVPGDHFVATWGSTGLASLQLKMLENVVAQPAEPKFRKVRISNTGFSTKVWTTPGGKDVLLAVGWKTDVEDGFVTLPIVPLAVTPPEASSALPRRSLIRPARARAQARPPIWMAFAGATDAKCWAQASVDMANKAVSALHDLQSFGPVTHVTVTLEHRLRVLHRIICIGGGLRRMCTSVVCFTLTISPCG